MKRIAITACGTELSSDMDARFGRAAKFIVFDEKSSEVSVHENKQNLRAAQGAGIQAAQQVVALDVDVVISGHIGPKAFRVFQTAGIPVYLAERASVEQVLQRFKDGELEQISDADVEGHWV